MDNPIAVWIVRLDADCPGCGDSVDLTDASDFWDADNHIQPAETRYDYEVVCPRCGHEFKVDTLY
jgi:endogenous inhibitor of DNA gyrase (YacG/DUF329 family)